MCATQSSTGISSLMCPKVKNENFFADSQGAEAERFVIYFVLKFLFFGKKNFLGLIKSGSPPPMYDFFFLQKKTFLLYNGLL